MRTVYLAVAIAWASCFCSCSPALADEPDPQQVLNEAKALNRQGKYAESLQKHLWYHENALRLGQGQTGVRLSFALADWVELGRKYPEAKTALVAIRDKDTRTFGEGGGSFELFQDVSSINDYLKEQPKTIELFKSIDEKDPDLAQLCYIVSEKDLAARGEYETCSKYIPDSTRRFERIKSNLDVNEKIIKEGIPGLRDFAERSFSEETCRVIDILVGSDRKPEAEQFRDLALAVRDEPSIRDAVSKAVDRKSAQTKAITLNSAPPVVVRTVPEAGASDIDPGTTEIRVTFSKAMQDGTWSWSTASEESYPKTPGKPTYAEDGRTCILPVKLEPGKTYAIWVNSQKFRNFKDARGISAVPFFLVFKTKG